ncbi:MAG: alkaline phosphatase family protein, partial [Janthinobacterium lividum]
MRTGLCGFAAGLVAIVGFGGALAAPAAASPPARPKLVVVISIDQFSAALFDQYRASFTGGMRQLQGGVVYANGYQSHAATETCPGHSTILTGGHPAATGIIANNWFDGATGTSVYCVFDPAGPVPGRDHAPRGPANLKVSTLGEWMKSADPRSRVFTVSGKDRAAIMLAGHNPDGVFWWDDEHAFTTSVPAGTTEAARLAPVADFNAGLVRRFRAVPPAWQPIDRRCATGGSDRFGDLTINHALPPEGYAGAWNDPASLKYFRASPVIDEVTLDLARTFVDRFKLGRGVAPDLLGISLSATDYVGHRYGPGGPEMCDNLAHLDRALGAFFAHLVAAKLSFVVVLTADHGSVDAAERVAKRGFPARRIGGDILFELGRSVQAELGLDYDPLAGDLQQISITGFGEIDPATTARISAATIRLLRARPDVAAVFTKAEVLAAVPRPGTPVDELTLAERFHESTDAERSADIMVAYLPY